MLFDGNATLEALKEMDLKNKTIIVMSTISIEETQGNEKLFVRKEILIDNSVLV